MLGYVKAWNKEKGWGFLCGQNGVDYFVHHSGIAGKGYKSLTEGEDVEFELEKNDRGIMAVYVKQLEDVVSE